MIRITTEAFDPQGAVTFRTVSGEVPEVTRRVSRTATLDGGAVIVDGGYSDGDITFAVSVPVPLTGQEARLRYILRNHDTVKLTSPEGVWRGALQNVRRKGSALEFTFLATEKVTGD